MPIRVATRRSSFRSELNSTGPSTITKLNGGAWSSTHKHAYRSRRSAAPLTDVAPVVNTTSSPSRTNQTGTTCGLPSLRTVATLAVRAGWPPGGAGWGGVTVLGGVVVVLGGVVTVLGGVGTVLGGGVAVAAGVVLVVWAAGAVAAVVAWSGVVVAAVCAPPVTF